MDLSTLPAIGYASWADAIRRRLGERELNALAVSDMTNLRWLTGFTGSSALVVLLPDRLVLVTDGRYADRAQAETAAAGVDAEIRVGFTQAQQHDLFVDACAGAGEIGADAAKLSHQRWQAWSKEIAIVPADGVVEDARRVKDAGEVARIAAAAGAPTAPSPTWRRCSPADRRKPMCEPSSSTACAGTVRTGRATTRSSPRARITQPGLTTRSASASSRKATRS